MTPAQDPKVLFVVCVSLGPIDQIRPVTQQHFSVSSFSFTNATFLECFRMFSRSTIFVVVIVVVVLTLCSVTRTWRWYQ